MVKCLSGLEDFSSPYIDDIVIFSNTWDDHLVYVVKVWRLSTVMVSWRSVLGVLLRLSFLGSELGGIVGVGSLIPSRRSFPHSPRQFASPLPMISIVDQSLPPEIQQLFLTFCPNSCINPSPDVAQSFILYVFIRQNRVQNRTCENLPPPPGGRSSNLIFATAHPDDSYRKST